jgi:hypothetical protein
VQSLQLGVVGNLQISSLIDARGRHVWTCWPRPDADPIFCSLLAGGEADVAGGFYDVVLDRFVRAEQAYVHPFCARPCTTNAAQCGSTTSLRTSYSFAGLSWVHVSALLHKLPCVHACRLTTMHCGAALPRAARMAQCHGICARSALNATGTNPTCARFGSCGLV